MNQTQGLGNAPFSTSHNVVLEEKDRRRVSKQIYYLLTDWIGKRKMSQSTILDIGCSSGVITRHIASYCKNITGVDVDKNAIEIAHKTYKKKNLNFITISNVNLPFKKNSFDIVIYNQVYAYVSDQQKSLSEIYRVLKNDGICLFTGDNLLYPMESLYHLPIIKWFPNKLQFRILKKRGVKNIYIGNYKTYWQIKKLLSMFEIEDYSIKVIKKARKYKYKKLYKYQTIAKIIPDFIMKALIPFFPTFVFLLKKTE